MEYSERLRPYGPTIGEDMQGSLPSIDALRQDFNDQTRGINRRDRRVLRLTHLTKELREKAAKRGPAASERLRQQDSLATLFLDCVDYTAWERVLIDKKVLRQNGAEVNIGEVLDNHMSARLPLQESIQQYEQSFVGVPDQTLYNGLLAVAYDAACLVHNKEDLGHNSPEGRNVRSSLTGLLSEHKVLKALQESGMASARYSTVYEDARLKWDIVVPSDNDDEAHRAVQVKSRVDAAVAPVAITVDETGVIQIRIPTNGSQEYFSLHKADARRVVGAVSQAPPAEVPRMASAFRDALAKSET